MAAQVSEILDQQTLTTGIGFPVQTAAVVTWLISAQPLVIIDASAPGRLPVILSVRLHALEQRHGSGQWPGIDQGALL